MAAAKKPAAGKAVVAAQDGEALYEALTPISHGRLDDKGNRASRIYQPGDTLALDDDQAAVLLARKAIAPASEDKAPE